MKFYLDTEFHEYKKQPKALGIPVGKPIDTIELISIGIVGENPWMTQEAWNNRNKEKKVIDDSKNRAKEYYAICKDFDIKAAWNNKWLRKNVLKPIWGELRYNEDYSMGCRVTMGSKEDIIDGYINKEWVNKPNFTYKELKFLINKYGKTRKQIAEEIIQFTNHEVITNIFVDNKLKHSEKESIEFYAYYADYDHVCLSWLYGRMAVLPTGFPQYTKDIQQMIDDNNIDKELLLKEVPQINCHNSLQDAIWNKKAYNWIAKQLQ